MDLTVDVSESVQGRERERSNSVVSFSFQAEDILARLVLPESNRLFYLIEGLDAHKHIYTSQGVQSQLPLADAFEKR